jgi:hypothetical protein
MAALRWTWTAGELALNLGLQETDRERPGEGDEHASK